MSYIVFIRCINKDAIFFDNALLIDIEFNAASNCCAQCLLVRECRNAPLPGNLKRISPEVNNIQHSWSLNIETIKK